MTQLPIESINGVMEMIKQMEFIQTIPMSLLLFLRVFKVSEEPRSYIILDSSLLTAELGSKPPLPSDSSSILNAIKRWIWDHLCGAIDKLHVQALELYKIADPTRCVHFLTKGKLYSDAMRKSSPKCRVLT